jgi:hypothetical protein
LPGHLKGSVVVLGSSQDGAGDIHQTPAGLMTGSEIILNAVRTLVEHPSAAAFREEPPASVFRVVFDRLVDLLPGFAIMTVTWLGIYFLLSRKSTSRGGWLVARTGVLVLFLLGLSLSLLVELILMSPSWLSDEPEAAPIDIVTPILALGLEAYADIAKLIVEKIEHYLDLALSALTSNIAWLRNRPIHPTVNENEDP